MLFLYIFLFVCLFVIFMRLFALFLVAPAAFMRHFFLPKQSFCSGRKRVEFGIEKNLSFI